MGSLMSEHVSNEASPRRSGAWRLIRPTIAVLIVVAAAFLFISGTESSSAAAPGAASSLPSTAQWYSHLSYLHLPTRHATTLPGARDQAHGPSQSQDLPIVGAVPAAGLTITDPSGEPVFAIQPLASVPRVDQARAIAIARTIDNNPALTVNEVIVGRVTIVDSVPSPSDRGPFGNIVNRRPAWVIDMHPPTPVEDVTPRGCNLSGSKHACKTVSASDDYLIIDATTGTFLSGFSFYG